MIMSKNNDKNTAKILNFYIRFKGGNIFNSRIKK